MVAAAIRDIRRQWNEEIYLWVENPVAAHVYRQLGFEEAPFSVTEWNAFKRLF